MVPQTHKRIRKGLGEGNFGLVDNLCRYFLEHGSRDGMLWHCLSRVAEGMGNSERALLYAERAIDAERPLATLISHRDRLRAAAAPPAPAEGGVLVIREWGSGFWSDVFQVVTMCYAAEGCGRLPVVYWGGGSLFNADPGRDAFTDFFDPVSALHPSALGGIAGTRFPDRWTGRDLLDPAPPGRVWKAHQSYGPALLFRPETVAVADSYGWAIEVQAWIEDAPRTTPGRLIALNRDLFARHLRPRRDVLDEVAALWRGFAFDGPTLAVHVRGTDKQLEVPGIAGFDSAYDAEVERRLGAHPDLGLFLLTDSDDIARRFRDRYGARVRTTAATRSSDGAAVHLRPGRNPTRIGREVLVDALLAARCDYFVGLGLSNVAQAIYCLKEWPTGAASLLGGTHLLRRHPGFYDMAWRKKRSAQTGNVLSGARTPSAVLPYSPRDLVV